MSRFIRATLGDVLYAFRTFRRAPLTAITIVSTVALGLGLVAVVFTVLNLFLFRVDEVWKPGELVGVERPRAPGSEEQIPFTRPEFEALRRETSVFSDAFAIVRGTSTRIDGRAMTANLVTGNFFQVLGVSAAMGRTLMPDDDEPGAGRAVIVLSHRGWSRHFAEDPGVVGRSVRVNGFSYEIVGVAPEGFRGLSIGTPVYWAPLSMAGQFRVSDAGREDEIGIDVIGRLKPGISMETAAAGLTVWATRILDSQRAGTGPASIRLEPRQGTAGDDPAEVLLFFAPIFFAFGLVLMIGCANVANLLLARGVSRQREIGIRLSLGASRRRIVRQLLTESLLLSLLAAAGGFVVSRVALAATIYAARVTMPAEVAESVNISVPPADWRVVIFLVAGSLASTVFFGLAPALRASRLELVRTIRGEVTRDARPSRARNLLITTQVGASALLLICAAVFLRSAMTSASADLGLRTADTVVIGIPNEPLRAAVVDAVSAHPVVSAVAASRPGPLSTPATATAHAGESAAASRNLPVGYRFVSAGYFDVLDIPVLRGRGFTQADRSVDAAVAMVSEATATALWPDGSALGQSVSLTDPESDARSADRAAWLDRPFTVVGIVRDVPGFRFVDWPVAVVYLPTATENPGTALTVRVQGDPDQARAALFDRLSTVDPAIGEITTLRMMAGLGSYLLGIAFWVSVVLGGLALLLTASGLFSVLSYTVEQRAREIGVRIALGATTRNITGLVRSQLVRPVGYGLVAGGGLAAALAVVLLSTPLALESSGLVDVLDPVAYGASLSCIIAACLLAAWVPARRAARIDPIETLRRD